MGSQPEAVHIGNPYISSNSQLVFARESSFGVRPTAFGGSGGSTTPFALGITNEDIEFPDKELDVKKYPSFGAGRQLRRLQPGAIDRSANLPLVLTNGLPIYYAFGSETFTAGSPNVHVLHTGSVGVVATASQRIRAILPSFSWAATMFDDANTRTFQRVFLGDVIDQATWSVSEQQELQMKCGIKAQDVEDEQLGGAGAHPDEAAPTVPTNAIGGTTTSTAGRPYMWFDSIVTVYGKEVCRVTNMELGLNNKLRTMRYLCTTSGQKPAEYLTGLPEFTVKMDFVPAGFRGNAAGTAGHYESDSSVSGRREGLYQLLEDESYGDVNIELRKAANADDSIKFEFTDCLFRVAKHPWKADGNEMSVGVQIEPRNFQVTVRDAIAEYGTV